MLSALDALLHLIHLCLIFFNLFGYVLPRTRKWHLYVISLTTASWFLLGLWYGVGYCPLTDWHWQIKEMRGETQLPASYIKYMADLLFQRNFSPAMVDLLTFMGLVQAWVGALMVRTLPRFRLKGDS